MRHLMLISLVCAGAVSTRCGTSRYSSLSISSLDSENGRRIAVCPGDGGSGMDAAGFDSTSASRIESRTKS